MESKSDKRADIALKAMGAFNGMGCESSAFRQIGMKRPSPFQASSQCSNRKVVQTEPP